MVQHSGTNWYGMLTVAATGVAVGAAHVGGAGGAALQVGGALPL